MSDSNPVTQNLQNRVAEIEAKLQDTIELLHLWKNEAFAYRQLAEALVEGQVSRKTARRALAIADPSNIPELK